MTDVAVRTRENEDAEVLRLEAFRTAVDAAGIVAMTDAAGTIVEANDNFCAISGYSREELVGRNHRLLNSGRHPPAFFKEMYATIGKGRVWRGELCNRRKDGSEYWVDTTIAPVFTASGRIAGYLALRIDITPLKETLAVLDGMAHRDSLTGLANRPSLLRRLQGVIDRPGGRAFALLFLDFDNFKLINDSAGHETGDRLLQAIAGRLQGALRASDAAQVARLGGDEFVVLLAGLASPADARGVAERLVEELSAPYRLDGRVVHCTPSIGVTTSDHGYGAAADMLRDADLAMYDAKAAGKGRAVVFGTGLRDRCLARHRTETDLRAALAAREFFMVYQPIVDLAGGAVLGAEALVRWSHPERGTVSPAEFIPVAEETGLIVPLGEWCLDESLRQLADWARTGRVGASFGVHVNVSRRQLLSPGFTAAVERALRRHDVPPGRVHLEVSETSIMEKPAEVAAKLRELKGLGVGIDMDDFGTGHSSLACLGEFPIDVLKIDRSFIAAERLVGKRSALLEGVVALADKIGLGVIAEGIESDAQRSALRRLGCRLGQGFLFARPSPAGGLTPAELRADA